MSAEAPCPGPCNSAYRRRCALYEADVRRHAAEVEKLAEGERVPDPPRPPDITPWPGEPAWCRKCQARLKAELADLDDLLALVAAIPPLPRPAETSAGKVSGSRLAPSPSARMDDIEDLGDWLRRWESAARREDDPRPRRGLLAQESTTVTAWLYHHFEALIWDPDAAGDFGAEISRWHRALSQRATAGQMQRHQNKPCPRCHLYTLWVTIGEDYVRCINEDCNRRMTREEYAGLADAPA